MISFWSRSFCSKGMIWVSHVRQQGNVLILWMRLLQENPHPNELPPWMILMKNSDFDPDLVVPEIVLVSPCFLLSQLQWICFTENGITRWAELGTGTPCRYDEL